MKRFVPRRLADGRVCCSDPDGLCPACKAAFAVTGLRSLEDYTPPNPYDLPLAAIKAAVEKARPPVRETHVREGFEPPDPYAAALEQLRREEKR